MIIFGLQQPLEYGAGYTIYANFTEDTEDLIRGDKTKA